MHKVYPLIGIVAALSITAIAQQNSAQPSAISGRTQTGATQSAAAGLGSLLAADTGLEAQLQNTIDVRKSKVGDEVVLKITKALKQNGETVVPKGTALVGRITEIQRKTKESSVSKVGMVFDRIQGRNLDVPINASIVSVAAAQVNGAAGDLFSTNATASSSSSASGGGTSSSGGGLLGGVGPTVGSLVNTTTQTVGNVASTATNAVGQTAGSAVSTVNGLQISSSASGSATSASTVSAQGKDVRIEKGATFQLRINHSSQN